MIIEGKTTRYGKETSFGWLKRHVAHQGDRCLIWPFGGCNGYGTLGLGRRPHYAHRVMCELVHGPSPSEKHEASHSCGNGHQGCVHPKHLTWKTPSENQRDRASHGTKNHGWKGKISQRQADEIRALKGKLPQREIAIRFGISRSNVSFIYCGKAWTGEPHKYSAFHRATTEQ